MEDGSRILVAYTTNAGSTKEVAERIGMSISTSGVDVLPVEAVGDLSGYSGFVIGGPMILGWHRRARKFLRKIRRELTEIPLHVFMTAMKVTDADNEYQVTVDPGIKVAPANREKLSFKEKQTTVNHYVAPLMKKNGSFRPSSIAIFGGKLDYTKLKLLQMLFVMVVIGEAPGEKRNWNLIESWATGLSF